MIWTGKIIRFQFLGLGGGSYVPKLPLFTSPVFYQNVFANFTRKNSSYPNHLLKWLKKMFTLIPIFAKVSKLKQASHIDQKHSLVFSYLNWCIKKVTVLIYSQRMYFKDKPLKTINWYILEICGISDSTLESDENRGTSGKFWEISYGCSKVGSGCVPVIQVV